MENINTTTLQHAKPLPPEQHNAEQHHAENLKAKRLKENKVDVEAPVHKAGEIALYNKMGAIALEFATFLEYGGSTVDRMKKAFWLEFKKNSALQNCSFFSVVDAFKRCCELGLEPNCERAYLIPYSGKCTVQIGVNGWRTLLWRNPRVANVYAYPVYANDEFKVSLGDKVQVHHIPVTENKGELIGSYAIVKLKDGEIIYKYCDKQEIEESRKASKTTKSDSPWNKYYEQMAVVTALRRLARTCATSIPAIAFNDEETSQITAQAEENCNIANQPMPEDKPIMIEAENAEVEKEINWDELEKEIYQDSL
jgi:phage RecT family recombinase